MEQEPIPQNPAVPNANPAPVTIPPKPIQKNNASIFLILITVILLGLTIFLAYQNYRLNREIAALEEIKNPSP
jgi:hypothetical protein